MLTMLTYYIHVVYDFNMVQLCSHTNSPHNGWASVIVFVAVMKYMHKNNMIDSDVVHPFVSLRCRGSWTKVKT